MKKAKITIEHHRRATARARAILQPGDRISFTRCLGKTWGIFKGFDGEWICTTTRRNDIAATSITKLNGRAVDFSDHGACDDHILMRVVTGNSPARHPGWNGTKFPSADCPYCREPDDSNHAEGDLPA